MPPAAERPTARSLEGTSVRQSSRGKPKIGQASILDKLDEGYTNDQLRDQLGFNLPHIQAARQTRAIADMARSLDLPEEVRAKLEIPEPSCSRRSNAVFDSSVGGDISG